MVELRLKALIKLLFLNRFTSMVGRKVFHYLTKKVMLWKATLKNVISSLRSAQIGATCIKTTGLNLAVPSDLLAA